MDFTQARIIAAWALLTLTISAVIVLARRLAQAHRRIADLEQRIGEATELEAVLRRARGGKRRRGRNDHLRLLGVLPPAAWLVAHVGRRHVAVAAASAFLAAGAVQVDERLHDTLPNAAPAPAEAETPQRPGARRGAVPPARQAVTTTTIAPPAAAPAERPAVRPPAVPSAPPPAAAPAPSTTTTLAVEAPPVTAEVAVAADACVLDLAAQLLGAVGLGVELCGAA